MISELKYSINKINSDEIDVLNGLLKEGNYVISSLKDIIDKIDLERMASHLSQISIRDKINIFNSLNGRKKVKLLIGTDRTSREEIVKKLGHNRIITICKNV